MWPECLLQIGYVLMHVLMHVLMRALMHYMHVLMRKLVDLCYVTTGASIDGWSKYAWGRACL